MEKKNILQQKRTVEFATSLVAFLLFLTVLLECVLKSLIIVSVPFIFLFGDLTIYLSILFLLLSLVSIFIKHDRKHKLRVTLILLVALFTSIYFCKNAEFSANMSLVDVISKYGDNFKTYFKGDITELDGGLFFLVLTYLFRSILDTKIVNILSLSIAILFAVILIVPFVVRIVPKNRKDKTSKKQKNDAEINPEDLETLEFDNFTNEYIGDEFIETVSETKKVFKEKINETIKPVNLFDNENDSSIKTNTDTSSSDFDVTREDLFVNKKIDSSQLDMLPKQEFNVFNDEIEGDIIATDIHGNRLKNIHVDETVRNMPTEDFFNDDLYASSDSSVNNSESFEIPKIDEQPNLDDSNNVSDLDDEIIEDSSSFEYKKNFGFEEEIVLPTNHVYPEKNLNVENNSSNNNFSTYHEIHYESSLNEKTLDGPKYTLPPVTLLDSSQNIDSSENQLIANIKSDKLNTKLQSLGVKGRVHGFIVAPSFTRFQIEVDDGYRVKGLQEIRNDIMMALEAEQISILTPIPGTSYAGIDIPNKIKTLVTFKECLLDLPYEKRDQKLLCAIGKDCLGKTVYMDLFETQHLLVAGSTGSGKSGCLNSIIMSIIMRDTPEDVRFLLIDPKGGEFKFYNDIPHLLCPVVNRADEANEALKRIVSEVKRRNDIMTANDTREIVSYNKKATENGLEVFPYIVIVIDELQSLMEDYKADIEASIKTITALARSSGIYIICATQSPRKEIITGIIRTNLPSCIACAVRSQVDSRVVMDECGAEELLGKGDMLLKLVTSRSLNRVQGCFVSDDEKTKVVNYWRKQSEPIYNKDFVDLKPSVPEAFKFNCSESDRSDEYYPQVLDYLLTVDEISITMIQRRFGMGQPRAGKIIDMLEQDGYISSKDGNKPRMIFKNKLPGYNDSFR